MMTQNVRAPEIHPLALAEGPTMIPRTTGMVEKLLARQPTRAGIYEYDAEAAHLLAVAASWAYSDPETLSEMMVRQGLGRSRIRCACVSNHAMFVDATSYVIQSECGRLAILCFRGTEPTNLIDWFTNASLRQVKFRSTGYVHDGFYRNVRATWRDIIGQLERARQGKPLGEKSGNGHDDGAYGDGEGDGEGAELNKLEALYITGHSLGGAMAVIAAALLFEDLARPQLSQLVRGIYTFGQPMVGDELFASRAQERFGNIVFRHVFSQDVVPRLPPTTVGRFHHFGHEYASAQRGWIRRPQPTAQALTLILSNVIGGVAWLARQSPMLRSLRLPMSWADHSPLHYLQTSEDAVGAASEFD